MLDGGPDPLASIAITDIEVQIADDWYVLAGRDAVAWLKILLDDPVDLGMIVPGMLSDEDQEQLEDHLLAGVVTAEQMTLAAKDALTVASGRSWWWSLRMMAVTREHWLLLFGPLVASGMRLPKLPLGAFLDAVYHRAVSLMKQDQKREFDRELEVPPAGETVELDEQRESASFLALMNQGV